MAEQGKFIVIEGTDATGKSTQVNILADRLAEKGIQTVSWHEPNGPPISSEIRTVLLNGSLERSPETNLLLFTASRLESWRQTGLPAIKMGKWAISARNHLSTLVYQSAAEGLSEDLVMETTARFMDRRYMSPDQTIILDFEEEDEFERISRINKRGPLKNPDTFESRDDDFQQRIVDGYRQIAKEFALPIVSARGSTEEVADRIWRQLDLGLD